MLYIINQYFSHSTVTHVGSCCRCDITFLINILEALRYGNLLFVTLMAGTNYNMLPDGILINFPGNLVLFCSEVKT
jgi:hypothetical protein